MTEEFNKWWNSDGLVEDNPYERDTPAFWAWEGWQAATKEKREWQGLTDEEILEEYRQSYGDDGNLTDVYFARAIEAKLKEKNT